MRIEEFITHILATNDSDGWSQMSRSQLIKEATDFGVSDPVLCADACNAIGIGELSEGETSGPVVFVFYRPSINDQT